MLTRFRKAMDKREEGFTLIELLVVMIIIGILAAIAIPVFLSQRSKANDASAKADANTVGKEIATYFVDGTTAPTVTITNGRYVVAGNDAGAVSKNNAINSQGFNTTTPSTKWCVAIKNTGSATIWKYTADGLSTGACATPADY